MSPTLEEVAHQVAAQEAKLATHEAVCSERYGRLRDDLSELKALLFKVLWSSAGLLVTVLGYMLVKYIIH